MKKYTLIISILLILVTLKAYSYEELKQEFLHANSYRIFDEMKNIIEKTAEETKNANIMALNAEAMTEIANWGYQENKTRKELYEKAVEKAKKAVEIENNTYTNYVAGAAIGRLAQFSGIFESMFLLGDFDKYFKQSIECDCKNYGSLVAMGMRYRDTPWPMKNDKKAEEYLLKALEAEPAYINTYYELGIFYKNKNDKEKAIKMFNKVIELPPHENWIIQGKEAKKMSKIELENLQK